MNACLHFIYRCLWEYFFSCSSSGMLRGAGHFHLGVPVSSQLKIVWVTCTGGSILSLLFTSLKTINPSEWQRLSLILDGLNHLLVSTGAPATLLLLEILERWWRWGWSVPNCSVPALCSLCLHPIRNDQFWSEWVKTAELKEKTVTTHMCKRAELQEVCCHETRGPSFI